MHFSIQKKVMSKHDITVDKDAKPGHDRTKTSLNIVVSILIKMLQFEARIIKLVEQTWSVWKSLRTLTANQREKNKR